MLSTGLHQVIRGWIGEMAAPLDGPASSSQWLPLPFLLDAPSLAYSHYFCSTVGTSASVTPGRDVRYQASDLGSC